MMINAWRCPGDVGFQSALDAAFYLHPSGLLLRWPDRYYYVHTTDEKQRLSEKVGLAKVIDLDAEENGLAFFRACGIHYPACLPITMRQRLSQL